MRHRIVSLIPSSTEIVCALGFEDQLIGRSHECDYPQKVIQVPACTSPKFDPDGTSYRIDQKVKAVLQDALSVYRVDGEKLRQLNPTAIITQSQCEVCAVSLKEVEQAVYQWLDSKPTIVALEPNSFDDVWRDILRVAQALGVEDRGQKLIQEAKHRMGRVVDQVKSISVRPRVVCVEWLDPLMSAGNWMPTLVEMAGGINLFGEAGKHSPWMQWEEIVEKDPDIIVLMPCGFDIRRTEKELNVLTDKVEWKTLKAVKSGNVFITDGNQYLTARDRGLWIR